MHSNNFIKLPYTIPEEGQVLKNVIDFRLKMNERRSVRFFSPKQVAKEVVEHIIMTASSAPSGAHKQPWTFCAVSDLEIKAKIREEAEKEEYENYHGRMADEWIKDLEKFETNWHKEFLTVAPWLIIVFKKSYNIENGKKTKNYYVNESVGIACGFLITAIHMAGLVTLTHTPSPMNFLQKILNRPENEKPFLILPLGYPMDEALVPFLERKSVNAVVKWY
ncbi:MAG: nitroreductase family protein [Saprospiraceae bacterium]|nr:nitroreductase family protein [Saprospiraceae bacterium]